MERYVNCCTGWHYGRGRFTGNTCCSSMTRQTQYSSTTSRADVARSRDGGVSDHLEQLLRSEHCPKGLGDLLARAREQGYLLNAEVTQFIVSDTGIRDMESLVEAIVESGIPLVTEAPQLASQRLSASLDGETVSSAGSGARAAEAPPWFSPEDAEYYRWLMLQIRPYARLTPHDEAGLGRRIAQGDRAARDRMLEDNERLVINVATKYAGRGLPFSDLVGEGNLGLIRAVSKFDHARGSRFYNYAVWWIFQSITRALAEQSFLIRMPVHLTEVVNKAQTSRETLLREYGREPTEEELASATEIPIERIPEYLQLGQEASSRQDTSPNDDRLLRDIVAGRTRVTPEDDVFDWNCGAQLERLLQTLPVRDQRIIILREGLQGEDVHTLGEVGAMFQLSRERIRQIEAKARRKLKDMIANESGIVDEELANHEEAIRHRKLLHKKQVKHIPKPLSKYNEKIPIHRREPQREGDSTRREASTNLHWDEHADIRQKWLLGRVLTPFSELDRKILVYRMGLQGESEHTLDEVSTVLNVTRERIRQVEAKAKQKVEDLIAKEDEIRWEDTHNDHDITRHRT